MQGRISRIFRELHDQMNIVPSASGVIRVEGAGPRVLGATLAKIDLKIPTNGYIQWLLGVGTSPYSDESRPLADSMAVGRRNKPLQP